MNAGQEGTSDNKVQVAVATTSGMYPDSGFNDVPPNQKVKVQLQAAGRALKLTNTDGWITTVNSPAGRREIDPDKSYAENGLAGAVTIDWGPTEGGGGAS